MAEGIRTMLATVASWLDARLLGSDREFHGVSTDSRAIEEGMLFVALKGPHHDGHEHVAAAAAGGAVAALVERPQDVPIPQLLAADTRLALGRLAALWREHLAIPLVAVTGSNGKTTVKEMCAAILAQAGRTLSTRGNLNNEIGVPLTLLRLEKGHDFGVIELGANHPGEIAYLTGLVKPQVAIITNAGPAHLEGFGTIEGVAHAKGEIYQGLSDDGVAVINADDAYADLWRELTIRHRTLSFGLERPADIGVRGMGDLHGSELEVLTPLGEFHLSLPLPGRHNIMNALAAIGAAIALGIELEVIAAGLNNMVPVGGRLQIRDGINGATILDDSYNANPSSMHAGLEVLAGCDGERYLAMGDMGELGEQADVLHRQVGIDARELGIDRLYATGRMSRYASEAFGENGFFFSQQQQLIDALLAQLNNNTTVLVKGSRSSHMERVVEALTAGGEA
ncbi:MAG: UDP-N-acetylmuramoyl-tripeptide--D-alanyl-D-alanine ligase [Gammaproteobacteria bacterium]|nr:UDP-N-acetylmuramoyl-tripeptide--D-alanyl-D-alanine ligase [Gammaproteobacteria bacterium]MCW8928082.1 UDP-N-acetylmuramoyl-tripeptide--D-alanyl-D-alanine ligase [Gammaproteobacteria bacterium]MCW8959729.1 UDP-N-acetylmuramoyl-tripeptide--D-alanyl-D-alanine ligase [Gammaproteobacteria bacterium]MCW8971926.1 UDP-N-acetylmuramoyl-tripeptide--D-alanyl-D-alanine ligase [Gammaproteobacteria bacterium]MCW8991785.1 UDP-N-acetylmuramoyl-tripeptide--D-alanyl-D-alanine ligase [Gammaproteobacteria bact